LEKEDLTEKMGNISISVYRLQEQSSDVAMSTQESTCWTVIAAAAAGCAAQRTAFAQRYQPVIRSYLAARWRNTPYCQDLEDAVQEVFVVCFQRDGLLARAERDRPGGFRAFLYGVVRNVARRLEAQRGRSRQAAGDVDLDRVPAEEESQARLFDRAWARSLLREAAQRQEDHARCAGAAALRRVELLRLRFHDGLPIRAIAARWQIEAATLHHEYAKARQEFKAALAEVVGFHHPGSAAEIERQCANLLSLLD
jgi:RNA polymerase sigma factor (sigma-70 family)